MREHLDQEHAPSFLPIPLRGLELNEPGNELKDDPLHPTPVWLFVSGLTTHSSLIDICLLQGRLDGLPRNAKPSEIRSDPEGKNLPNFKET